MNKLVMTSFVVAMMAVGPADSQRIVSTYTSTLTTTCVTLANVTGACRRRRGFQIEEPIVLAMDDLDDFETFQPSNPLW